MRAYALLSDRPNSEKPGDCALVVVNLETMKYEIRYPIASSLNVTSLAVSPDGSIWYVTDAGRSDPGGVIRLDASPGYVQQMDTTLVEGAQDCVLSTDGRTLYVAASLLVLKIDTSTMKTTATIPVPDALRSIALSEDDQTLAIASAHLGLQGRVYLVDALNMKLIKTIDIQEENPNKLREPPDIFDVIFADTGRVLVWSLNLNAVYQIDVATEAQVNTDTIDLGLPLDPGVVSTARNLNNQLSYGKAHRNVSAKAYLARDSQLVIIDGLTSVSKGGFSGTPFMARIAPSGKSLYVCVEQAGTDPLIPDAPKFFDALDLYEYDPNTKTYKLTPAVFKFDNPHMFVRDLRIIDPVDLSFPVSQYVTLANAVHILSGIVNDAAGVYVGADGKLHHLPAVDPTGDPIWRRISSTMRDALLGLTLNGIASVIHNPEARHQLQRDALSLTRRAVEQMLDSLELRERSD